MGCNWFICRAAFCFLALEVGMQKMLSTSWFHDEEDWTELFLCQESIVAEDSSHQGVLPFPMHIGGRAPPWALTQTRMVTFSLELPVLPGRDSTSFLATTVVGRCSNCFPVSSMFLMRSGVRLVGNQLKQFWEIVGHHNPFYHSRPQCWKRFGLPQWYFRVARTISPPTIITWDVVLNIQP